MPSNPSGILSPTDPEFLREVPNYYDGETPRQARYQRRKDVRHRITKAVLDFQDITPYLDPDQRQKIFAEPENNGAEDDVEFGAALEMLLKWVYLGCRETDRDFESLLQSAVGRGEEDYRRRTGDEIVDVVVDFDVDVTQRYEGVDAFARSLEDGEPLLARNFYKLPTVGEIPVDPEKVEVVKFIPEDGQKRPNREKEMVRTILNQYLGIEADIEVVGVADIPEDVAEHLDWDGDEEPTGVASDDR